MQRVDWFLEKHPDWHLRIYRTPAGLRLLAMHQTFGPDEEVAAVFLVKFKRIKFMCR